MTLGILMQAAQAFQRLTSSLSWPVDNMGEIARCRASAERVLSLYQAMEAVDAQAQSAEGTRISVHRTTEEILRIDDLSMSEPSGETLLQHFSAVIRPGERVLLTGNPLVAAGLFKVAAGLWSWGSGHVALPRSGMMFVAQRPFLPEGTLRAALCYPDPEENFGVEEISRVLDRAGLHWLIPRLEERSNWEQVLTLHAQQRFGIARVLLKRPAWLFMDEATDAFKPEGERRILTTLQEELPESTLLTISFHPGLDDLHHRTIVLEQPGEAGTAPAA
jgi:putative ATP-binding cassette transporter